MNNIISREQKEQLLGQISKVIWFTGLSGAGKSTLSTLLETELFLLGFKTCRLDGDEIRQGLNSDLTFTDKDRTENIRRVGETAKLFLQSGVISICSFITPFQKDRNWLRSLIGSENFIEIFVDCPLDVCITRDVKGLYKMAAVNEVSNFTGINSNYEIPDQPDLTIQTNYKSKTESLHVLLEYIVPLIKPNSPI